MSLPLHSPPSGKTPLGLISVVAAHLPQAEVLASTPPEAPSGLFDRQVVALVFDRHPETIVRWDQLGWLKAVRKPSGRVLGYPVEQVVSIGARLFAKYPNTGYDEIQARRVGLDEILKWTRESVQVCVRSSPADLPPPLDILCLAALSDSVEAIPKGWNVTKNDLDAQRGEAMAQLRRRLFDPRAKRALLSAWREGGVFLALGQNPNQQPA